jgi:hypothetical protein
MNIPNLLRSGLAIAISILVLGCAGKTNDAAPKFSEGKHPTNWLSTHWSEYAKAPDQCATCHGSVKDPAKSGGIAQVSCFTCHPNGPAHPEGWASGLQHGRVGAKAVAADWSGFASCTRCHGDSYTGGITPVSCKSCHTKAPHPDRPWKNADPNQPNHDGTDVSNAPECYKCHKDGANSTRVPSASPAPGATPGCYNNTLCHDRNV